MELARGTRVCRKHETAESLALPTSQFPVHLHTWRSTRCGTWLASGCAPRDSRPCGPVLTSLSPEFQGGQRSFRCGASGGPASYASRPQGYCSGEPRRLSNPGESKRRHLHSEHRFLDTWLFLCAQPALLFCTVCSPPHQICMDARILPSQVLGLAEGDVHVIRNACVCSSPLASTAVSLRPTFSP